MAKTGPGLFALRQTRIQLTGAGWTFWTRFVRPSLR